MNLLASILSHSSRMPDRVAIHHSRGSLTYSALAERIRKVANGLKRYSGHHEKVAILIGNRIEFVEIFLGAVYAGCVPVPLDPKWSTVEINAVLRQCEPGILIAEDALAQNVALPSGPIKIVTLSQDHPSSYHQWIDSFAPEAEPDDSSELLFIGFTSGTTGIPKGYMRTPLSWLATFEATKESFRLDMKHCMAPGPLVHSLSLFAMIQSLHFGATFHLVEQFNADEVIKLCHAFPEMILFVVPTMIDSLLQQADLGTASVQALISSGGKWSELSKHKCREVFKHAKLLEYYGSSEASYISYMNVHEVMRPGSVGRPFHGVEVSIRDEHFKEVPVGKVGQLYVRSGMMFSGYYRSPEETAAVFRDGWLQTGDYMFSDNDGYLFLAGRSKNRMVTGGLNVFPEEVETVLQRIPAIQEVMVLGMPDDRWGEKVTAVIQWRGDQRLSLNEVKGYCRNCLASYKAPKELVTVDRFIYTSSGKVARQRMKEYVGERMK